MAASGRSVVATAVSPASSVCTPDGQQNSMLCEGKAGVLTSKDALYGPTTKRFGGFTGCVYEWEEEFVLDLVIRYWEKPVQQAYPCLPNLTNLPLV